MADLAGDVHGGRLAAHPLPALDLPLPVPVVLALPGRGGGLEKGPASGPWRGGLGRAREADGAAGMVPSHQEGEGQGPAGWRLGA